MTEFERKVIKELQGIGKELCRIRKCMEEEEETETPFVVEGLARGAKEDEAICKKKY